MKWTKLGPDLLILITHTWQLTLFTDSLFMQFYVALNKRVNVKLRTFRKFYER